MPGRQAKGLRLRPEQSGQSDIRAVEKQLYDVGRDRPSAPYSFWRRLLRGAIHFFSYHFILTRKSTREARAAGFRLLVLPTVFHPRFFLTSEYFAKFIDRLDLRGKTVAEVGTGSGVLSLAAARAGAERVVAIDINPNAALAAAENARRNDLGDRVFPVCCDLMTGIAAQPFFDVIISNPPYLEGEPLDIADRAWHAGPDYRDIRALFSHAHDRLRPDGRFYLLLSSDTDFGVIGKLIQEAGFAARQVKEHSIVIESFIIYELTTA